MYSKISVVNDTERTFNELIDYIRCFNCANTLHTSDHLIVIMALAITYNLTLLKSTDHLSRDHSLIATQNLTLYTSTELIKHLSRSYMILKSTHNLILLYTSTRLNT